MKVWMVSRTVPDRMAGQPPRYDTLGPYKDLEVVSRCLTSTGYVQNSERSWSKDLGRWDNQKEWLHVSEVEVIE